MFEVAHPAYEGCGQSFNVRSEARSSMEFKASFSGKWMLDSIQHRAEGEVPMIQPWPTGLSPSTDYAEASRMKVPARQNAVEVSAVRVHAVEMFGASASRQEEGAMKTDCEDSQEMGDDRDPSVRVRVWILEAPRLD